MANRFKDLTGKKYGDLTAVRRIGSDSQGNSVWSWQCDCGRVVELTAHVVKRGHNLSCGCRRKRKSQKFAEQNAWAENRVAFCSKCNQTKRHTEFRKQYRGKPTVAFPRAWCAECDNQKHSDYYRGTPEKKLAWALRTIRVKAEQQHLPFDLAVADFLPIPSTCPALGTVMNYDGKREAVPTFDRRIPELGYVKGNVRLISHRANRIKSDATLDELKQIVTWLEAQVVNLTTS